LKILILKRDKLGDLLLTTPVFAALRRAYPDARIDLLASDYNAWVAEGNAHLDRILSYRRVRIGKHFVPGAAWSQVRLFFALRRDRYDIVIVAQGEDSPRAVQRAIWTGARRVISYALPQARYGRRLTDALAPPLTGHEAQRLLGLLKPLGIESGELTEAPEFHLPRAAQDEARLWLAEAGLAPKRYVVLGLGARRARKQPTTEQIVRWITRLKDEWSLDTVFMWTPGDAGNPLYPGDDAIAEPVLAARPRGLVPFRGALIPALGLIFSAQTSIFPDSGLMHFASTSPGGVLGLFGDEPLFAEKWAPLGRRSRHLVAPLVSSLSDEAIFAALGPLLQARHD
jgi:ADP-heptose:LPS heptosyltransferase